MILSKNLNSFQNPSLKNSNFTRNSFSRSLNFNWNRRLVSKKWNKLLIDELWRKIYSKLLTVCRTLFKGLRKIAERKFSLSFLEFRTKWNIKLIWKNFKKSYNSKLITKSLMNLSFEFKKWMKNLTSLLKNLITWLKWENRCKTLKEKSLNMILISMTLVRTKSDRSLIRLIVCPLLWVMKMRRIRLKNLKTSILRSIEGLF